jgi:hypothetical protein
MMPVIHGAVRRSDLIQSLMLVGAAVLILIATPDAGAQSAETATVLYETGFEPTEGFQPGVTLMGQGGWLGTDAGGNGLLTGYFDGLGQHAFVGYSAPEAKAAEFVNVWKPLPSTPPPDRTIVRFSVRMQIVESANGHKDDFRWSLYNTNGARLFTLDFDTSTLGVSYALDKPTDFTSTGFTFDMLGTYDLAIWMDFGRNLWSARLNDMAVVNSRPITASGAPLNLGDIDAVWAIRQPGAPGDNFMVMDDYRIASENTASIPPHLDPLGIGKNGAFIIRVAGEEGLNYSVDASDDATTWHAVVTIKAPAGGMFDYEDPAALQTPHRLFRVRQVP